MQKKLNNLISTNIYRILMPGLVLLGFFCLLSLRYFQSEILKMVMLYAANMCTMFIVILYKKSINKYEIGIFCFLCVQLFAVVPAPSDMDVLVSTSYLLSYRYGVSSRSLIATVVDFFINDGFISKNFVWNFILSATIFISFIISVYLGVVIQKTKDELKTFLFFLTLLYLSCFTAPAAYFLKPNFGRLEIFAFLFMLIIVIIINKPKVMWLIPLLALLTLATHIILIFFYIPFVIVMLLHEIFTKKERNKQAILLLTVTILIISCAFLLYVSFYEKTFIFKDAQSFSSYLSTKTDLNFSEGFLYMIMYGKLQNHIDDWNNRTGFAFSGNVSILINIPLLVLFVAFWLKCFFKESRKTMKYFFLLPILTLLFQSLAFFMFFDFGRWMIMILNVQFMLIFYLVYVKNETVLLLAKTTFPFIIKNAYFIILIFLTMTFLGPVNQIAPSERIMRFFKGFLWFLQKM